MFVAQGTIVALTVSIFFSNLSSTLRISLQNSFQLNLHIALNCTVSCTAEGELLKDENWLHFSATETDLIVSGLPLVNCEYSLNYIRVYHQASNLYTNSNQEILCGGGESSVTITYENLTK